MKSFLHTKEAKERIEKLCIENGHAINANNGRCGLIEDHLCRAITFYVKLLAEIDEALLEEKPNA
jgi:hypothetical protein